MPEWVYGVIGFIVLTIVLSMFSKRQKSASWQATVLDIREHSYTDSNENQRDEVIITYRLDNGGTKKWKLDRYAFKQVYSDLKVGDRLVKEKGEYQPKRVTAG